MIDRRRRQTILIAEDTPANIDILIEALADRYDISVAIDGETVLNSVRRINPDLILLDVVMPGIDGYEVCRRLKEDQATKNIPVIFLTSLSLTDNEERGLNLGAVDYITRPFNPRIVEARVHTHLELNRYRVHLENIVAERTADLNATREATIQSMAILAEFRDTDTGGHIRRTREYVRILLTYLHARGRHRDELTHKSIEQIAQSAPLHDIGKVGVPDRILRKPSELSPEEYGEMKRHPLYGGEAIRRAEESLGENSFLRYAREIAESHHENWDGSGYPLGLAGEQIPISARAMAVADVYDALVSARAYKQGMSHEEALRMIREKSGTKFDPEMVEALVATQHEFHKVSDRFKDGEVETASPEGTPDAH